MDTEQQNPNKYTPFTVYEHTFPNGKRYVGMTAANLEAHFNEKHRTKTLSHPRLCAAILKYGWLSVVHRTLAENVSESEAFTKVKKHILIFNLDNPENGYNVPSDMSIIRRVTEETREKMRQAHLGKTFSEETKEKMSLAHKGKKVSEETKAKLRKPRKRRYTATGKLRNPKRRGQQTPMHAKRGRPPHPHTEHVWGGKFERHFKKVNSPEFQATLEARRKARLEKRAADRLK